MAIVVKFRDKENEEKIGLIIGTDNSIHGLNGFYVWRAGKFYTVFDTEVISSCFCEDNEISDVELGKKDLILNPDYREPKKGPQCNCEVDEDNCTIHKKLEALSPDLFPPERIKKPTKTPASSLDSVLQNMKDMKRG